MQLHASLSDLYLYSVTDSRVALDIPSVHLLLPLHCLVYMSSLLFVYAWNLDECFED